VVESLLKSFCVGNCFDLSLLLFLLFTSLDKLFKIDLFLMVDNNDDDSLGGFDVDDGEGGDGVRNAIDRLNLINKIKMVHIYIYI
jgi:hypothetical protein